MKKYRAELSHAKTLRITDRLRQQLKEPLGELISGTISECNAALRLQIHEKNPPRIVLVGDTVSRNAMDCGISADVIIVDNKEMRHETGPFEYGTRILFRVVNQQGEINWKSWGVVRQAIGQGNAAVLVEGEEDMLALVAISESPVGSLVAYGQPGEGIVIVTVSQEKKHDVLQLAELMDST